MPAIFLLVVGCMWTLSVVWMFLVIAGIADPPEPFLPIVGAALDWAGMLVGPVTLIVGSVLVLRRGSLRWSAICVVTGCFVLTGSVLYESAMGMHRQPLEAPTPYSFYIALLTIMLFADVAGFRVVTQLSREALPKL